MEEDKIDDVKETSQILYLNFISLSKIVFVPPYDLKLCKTFCEEGMGKNFYVCSVPAAGKNTLSRTKCWPAQRTTGALCQVRDPLQGR
jgi:hypothetical protein